MTSRSSRVLMVTVACFLVVFHRAWWAHAEQDTKVEETVWSPDGNIALVFRLEGGTPTYAVNFKGTPVIHPSALGVDLKDGEMRTGFAMVRKRRATNDETWITPWGDRRHIRNHYNELSVDLQQVEPPRGKLRLIFRVFDKAIAFRYAWPAQRELKSFEIMDELTEFVFARDHLALWAPALRPTHTEQLYAKTQLSELLRQSRLQRGDESLGPNPQNEPVRAVITPMTMRTDEGLYLVIHEADLTDYAAMQLQPRENNTLKCFLVPWSDGVKVRATAPCVSPWRLVMISDKLSDIVEETWATARNLNPPNKIRNTSWIRPGKYIGIWWGMHLGKYTWDPTKPGEFSPDGLGATTQNARKYIDFAAKYDFDAVLVEGWNKGWARDWLAHAAEFSFTEPNPEFDLLGVVRYARRKGVELISHHETGAVIDNYERQMEAACAQCKRLGIRYVKSGYVGFEPRVKRYDANGAFVGAEYLDGQFMVRHYRRAVELAAKYQIMLNIHEPIKGTGEDRTWPNLMTREGGRGQEWNAWAADGGNPPGHDVDLVFTRCLAGPFDFTPGILRVTYPEYRKNNRVNSTVAKQLAQFVAFYSPLQMAADLPENYEKFRDLFQFILDVPVDWDETRMLNGELGEYVTIARKERGGKDWFIGCMSDENARKLELHLGFLPKNKGYIAEIYRDADDAHWATNPYAYKIEKRMVRSGSVLPIYIAPGGGAAIRLRPAKLHELRAHEKK